MKTVKLTKTESDALSYLKAVGSVWVITAEEGFLASLTRLEKKGLVEFRPRPNNRGSDAFPTEKAASRRAREDRRGPVRGRT